MNEKVIFQVKRKSNFVRIDSASLNHGCRASKRLVMNAIVVVDQQILDIITGSLLQRILSLKVDARSLFLLAHQVRGRE